jgi:hypothetical protein
MTTLRRVAPFSLVAAVAGLVLAVAFAAGQATPPATPGTPAVATPCAALGTPVAVDECQPAGPGTPVAVDGLVVTLTAASTKAGPIDLTVEVRDGHGKAVRDATVAVRTHNVEMNHGTSVYHAKYEGKGRYLAKQAAMGMGGPWIAEVRIQRKGQPEASVAFLVTLSGPM